MQVNHRRLRSPVVWWSAVVAVLVATALVGAGSASGATGLAKYRKAVTKAEAPVQWHGPTKAVKVPKHKFLVVVSCTWALAGCKNAGQAAVKVAHKIGWRAKAIVVQDPTGYDQAMQTAITEGASAIDLDGIDQKLVQGAMRIAHKKHIPVVSDFQYNPGGPNGVNTDVHPSANFIGKILADQMIVNTKGSVNALFLADAEFSLPVMVLKYAKKELNRCKVCKVTYATPVNYTASIVGTTLPNTVVAAMRSNPNINSILVGFDVPATYIVPALDAAGFKGKVGMYSQLGDPVPMSYVRDNNILVGNVGASLVWGAWGVVDEIIRLLDHKPIVNEHIPSQLFASNNTKYMPPKGAMFTGNSAHFVRHYLALWKGWKKK